MAITYTVGTSSESTGSVTSTTVTLPSGLASGDYTIICVSANSSNANTITVPSGWTSIVAPTDSVNGSTSDHLAVFYRKWVSGDSGTVAITTASARVAATPIKVSGADGTTFVNTAAVITQAASGATTIVAPSITPTDTALVCVFNGRNATNGNFLTPWSALSAGMTKLAEASGKATTATNAGHCIGVETVTAGAATGTRQADPAVTTTGAMGASFALNVASTGTTLSPTGIASAESFGTVTAGPVQPTGIASAEAFGAPTIGPVQPTGIATAQAFGTVTVGPVQPAGIGTGESFGTPTITKNLTASPTGAGTAEAFGAVVVALALTVSPTGIATAEAFGTLTATKTLTVTPPGVGTAETFGVPSITTSGAAQPTGITTAEAFGTPAVTLTLSVSPTGIGTAETVGTVTVSGLLTASPTGIASGEAFGTPAVVTGNVVVPTGIASAEVFGVPTAQVPWTARPTGIGTAELVNNVNAILTYTVTLTGIASGQGMGTPGVTQVLTVTPGLLDTGYGLGNPTVGGLLTVGPQGIGTLAQPGFPTVTYVTTMGPAGIPSLEALGSPVITIGADHSRDLELTFEVIDRRMVADPIDYRFTTQAMDPIDYRWDIAGLVERWTLNELDRPLVGALLYPEDDVKREILKSAGADEYVGGIITESTGKDISGATIKLALGSSTDPGAWTSPATNASGPLNVRKVTILVGATPNTPKGEYWLWAQVTDTPEKVTMRLPQQVIVR